MAIDPSQSKDVDLDRTDKLPILQGISIDEDIEDDAVHLEYSSSGAAPVHPRAQPRTSPGRRRSICPRSPRACAR